MIDNHVDKTAARASSASLGFMAGALLGAGLALLLAPATGAESRRRVGQTVKKLRNGMNHGVDKARELKDNAQSAVEAGRDAFSRAREHQSVESHRARP